MTNFERLEKKRQLEKLKSDLHSHEKAFPFLYLAGIACSGLVGLLILGYFLGIEITAARVGTAVVMAGFALVFHQFEKKELQKIESQINQLNREFDKDAKEKDRQDAKQKTADNRISSSAVRTAQLRPTVQPESRVEKQTTSVDIDSIFDENGCLQSLDALGDIFGDDSSYSDDTPKVLRR